MFSDRVTRTLFTLGELTLADPQYTGPFFDLDKIAKDVNDKVIVKVTHNIFGLMMHKSPSWRLEDTKSFWFLFSWKVIIEAFWNYLMAPQTLTLTLQKQII